MHEGEDDRLEDAGSRLDEILDVLHRRVYKALAAAGIEIPYSRHEVLLLPSASGESAEVTSPAGPPRS